MKNGEDHLWRESKGRGTRLLKNQVAESIHEVPYWKRRESIEKKPYQYTLSERKEPVEQEKKKRTHEEIQ